MQILVVDDQATNRAILTFLLEEDGHTVVEAENGLIAVELYKKHDIDIVLMDVIMPVMDGKEATKIIKDLQKDSNYVPVIFLTALDDDKALSQCLESGGDDFLSKPYNDSVLKSKIAAHIRIRELTKDITQKHQELTLHNSRWEREQNIVAHIFNTAMEHNLSDCDNLRSHIAPASTFNGDILLSAPSPTGGLYVFLGDFTGHGLGASIGTLPIAHSFEQLVARHLSVGEIAFEFNKMLGTMLPVYMFCCASIIELNSQGDSLQVWGGGLPDAYVINADGSIKDTLPSGNMPLGVEKDESKFNKGHEIRHLNKGERVIFFTDGIIEAESPEGEFFEEERLLSCFKAGTDDTIGAILETLNDFIQDAEQRDDITLFEVSAGPVVIHHRNEVDNQQDNYDGILWRMSCKLDSDDIRRANPVEEIMSILGAQTLIRTNKGVIGLVLSEMFNNALEHGILELSSDLKKTEDGFIEYYRQRQDRLDNLKNALVQISFRLIKSEEIILRIKITDSGNGFDTEKLKSSCNEDTFGRGIGLINRVCNRVEYLDGGSTLEVDFPISKTISMD
jgi:CheY-like chemotaxis protein/anti-sigma regulatory factor (Ser/Thr protein kinase)